jgi:hypothetical protein
VEPASRTIPSLEQAPIRVAGSAVLVVLVTCLLLLARLIPPLAIVIAWPLLFVVPGWLLAARAAPSLSPVGRLGAGVAISVVAAAHLVNVVGLVAGRFDRDVALVAALMLAIASVVLATQRLPGLAAPPSFDVGRLRSAIVRWWPAWTSAVLAAGVIGGVLALSSWHEVNGDWVSGGWNWSDFLVHVSIAKSLLAGNFPPQVPYAAGAPLAYHWFADFHGSIAAAAADVDVVGVFAFANAVMAAAFVLLVWELAVRVLGDRRVGVPAALLAIFGGGLGWVRLPIDMAAGKGDIATLLANTSYDNAWFAEWPMFKIASVLGTAFLPHRASAFGLPILVAVVLLAHVSFGRNRAGVVLAGGLAALLAPFSFFFFPAAYLIVLLDWFAQRQWQRPGWIGDVVAFIVPVVAGLPFIVGPILLQQDRGAFRFVTGWAEAPFGDGFWAVVFFYVTNLGIPLVLAAAALLSRDAPPSRRWLFAWAAALFAVPNLVVASAVEFDMGKYFQVMWIALALLAAWLIRGWPRAAVAAVVVASALSPALVAIWHVSSSAVALSGAQDRAAHWIAANTPERSVFVTEAFINSPVDLAGRLRVVSFGPYVANLGFDATSRERDVDDIYCGGDAVAVHSMARYHATYVMNHGGLLDCAGRTPTDFASSAAFTTVYDQEGVTIWQLAQP